MNMDKFLAISKHAIIYLFGTIIFFLFLLSIISSAYFGEYIYQNNIVVTNHTFYSLDNFLMHLIALLFFVIFILITKKLYHINKISPKVIYVFLSITISFIGVLFVNSLMLYPRADGGTILEIVAQVNDQNISGFLPGAYMNINPQQNGFFLVLYFIYKITGEKAYLVWQTINALAIPITYYVISKLTINTLIDATPSISLFTYLLCIMFIPYFFYSTFVYGNIIGQMFCFLSLYLTYETFEKKDIRIWILSAFSISFAIFIKSNSLIFLVAIVLYIIYQKLCKQMSLRRTIMLCSILFAFVIMQRAYSDMKVESITGMPPSSGTPISTYISMGLQETSTANGWWNGYTWNIYRENSCDPEATNQAAITDIKSKVSKMIDNPTYAIKFFIKKISSQWNNPEFGGIDVMSYRMSHGTATNTGTFFSESTKIVVMTYLNCYHSILLLGVILYLFYNYQKINISNLLPAIVFLGGFFFHILWEAMCQYAVSYMILLIPYSSIGWLQLSNRIENRFKRAKAS